METDRDLSSSATALSRMAIEIELDNTRENRICEPEVNDLSLHACAALTILSLSIVCLSGVNLDCASLSLCDQSKVRNSLGIL